MTVMLTPGSNISRVLYLLIVFGASAVILFAVATCITQDDLSTDEGVAAALKVKRSSICVSRPANLPNIIVAGDLILDRGCRSKWVFVNRKLYESDATQKGLISLGWLTADKKERERLALLWTEQVFLAFESPITRLAETNNKLPKQLTAPAVDTSADGTIVVKIWNKEPSGMTATAENRYSLVQYEMSIDGVFIEKKFWTRFVSV
jgi:hypothetical protein